MNQFIQRLTTLLPSKKNGGKVNSVSSPIKQPIILGLGNPGGEYVGTRHNIGRDIVIAIAEKYSGVFSPKDVHRADIAQVQAEDTAMQLVLTHTYMNESGKSLLKLIKSRNDRARLIVIHDDIDLPLGTWKIAWNRGEGGHNGLRSITESLHSKEYLRIRVGVLPIIENDPYKPKGRDAVTKFVLGKFSPEERAVVERVTTEIIAILPDFTNKGREELMNEHN